MPTVTVKCPMNTGLINVNGREYQVFDQHVRDVSEEDANLLAARPGYVILGVGGQPAAPSIPARIPSQRIDGQPAVIMSSKPMGKYKLKCPMQSGVAMINGRAYDVRDHITWVDDLAAANFAVGMGYMLLGMERWKTVDKVLVHRNGGLGDILMLTPIFKAMKVANPALKITLACLENFMEVLRHVETVDKIVPMVGGKEDPNGDGYTDATGEKYPLWLNMESVVEKNNELIPIMHRVDIFAKVAGFENGIPDKQMDYRVSDIEWEWAGKRLKAIGVKPGDKLLAMGLRTTCFNRNLPGTDDVAGRVSPVNKEIAKLAAKDGWKVVLFDHDGRYGWVGDNVLDFTGRTTIREAAAILAHCQMYVGPDTGTWHLACALRMPNVVYFGAMDYRLRVTSNMTRVMAKAVPCYPCNSYGCHNQRGVQCMDFGAQEVWDAVREKWGMLQAVPGIMETIHADREKTVKLSTTDLGPAGPVSIPQEAILAH